MGKIARVGAEPGRREDPHTRRESGALPHHPHRVAQILTESFECRPSPHFACYLLNQSHVAEGPVGSVRSLVGRNSGCGLFFGLEVQMRADLTIEIPIATAPRHAIEYSSPP